MPCIQIKSNVTVDQKAADTIRETLGRAIACFPGKSEEWLLLSIEDQCRMYFGGSSGRPIAMTEVKILGDHVDRRAAEAMTKEVTRVLGATLGVAPRDMYIKYEASPDWGWNGKNF